MNARPDWAITATRDMVNTLERALKGKIIDACDWPKEGGPAIYSQLTFSVSDKTKQELSKYIEFREKQRDTENWITVEEDSGA
jgi:hypothetical protein